MNVLDYQRGIADAQRGLAVYAKWTTDDYRTGVIEGRACLWLRSKGLEPPLGVCSATVIAKSKGWKP